MDDLRSLVKAAGDHLYEDTPAAMLGDHLSEQGDGRGVVIQKWLAERHIPQRAYVASTPIHQQEWFDVGNHNYRMETEIEKGQNGPVAAIHLEKYNGRDHYHRHFHAELTHTEARQLADSLPKAGKTPPTGSPESEVLGIGSADFHHFLDTHYGDDPRFTDALSKALKPA